MMRSITLLTRCLAAGTTALVTGAAAGCFSSGPSNNDGNGTFDVEIIATDALVFQSTNVTIQVGETIRWRNTGAMVHTVTFDPSRATDPGNVQLPAGVQPFSQQLAPAQTFSHTFTTAGEYRYICEPHELAGMVGTVTVTP